MTLKSFEELLEEGAAKPLEPVKASPEDLCTIMYTSGTTGDPKGVLIKHKNVLAEISAAKTFTFNVAGETFGPGDCFLSYLPLAHIFDRSACAPLPPAAPAAARSPSLVLLLLFLLLLLLLILLLLVVLLLHLLLLLFLLLQVALPCSSSCWSYWSCSFSSCCSCSRCNALLPSPPVFILFHDLL